jgi:hypothetical protein
MEATPQARVGVASALVNASREVVGLLGITVIGACCAPGRPPCRGPGLRRCAFLDEYHTGLLVTIGLLAVGVVVSYLTLRPRALIRPLPTVR